MITTKLIGGLGNQMFQYAAGRALALRLGVGLKLDVRAFSDYKLHGYGLNHFAIQAREADASELPVIRRETFAGRVLRRLGVKPSPSAFCEKAFTFDADVLTLRDRTYLDGYWQSERYFADFANEIRADLTVATPSTADNAMWLERIRERESVSLHVRRGDYVSNSQANAVHGTCDLDYYQRAVQYLVEKLRCDPVFYVFSDDPDWVAENLCLPHEMIYIRHNDAARNYEDLRLMASCAHHIIANSTFSWWGAWLNASPDKVVVAPKNWFRNDAHDARDLLPQSWVRL